MKERIQKLRSNNRLTSEPGIRSRKVTVLFVGQISARPAYNHCTWNRSYFSLARSSISRAAVQYISHETKYSAPRHLRVAKAS